MRRLTAIICLLCIFFGSYAQDSKKKGKKITIYGQIIDMRTKAGIDSVLVTIMRSDSTVVDTLYAKEYNSNWEMRSRTAYNRDIPAVEDIYIIRAEKEGYKTTFVNLDLQKIRRNRFMSVPTIKMQPQSVGSDLDGGELDELVVKATKIKMVHRGDTIVYNADAFNLEEGSMLDALVRQLPGAELTSEGEIKVNGEKVEELTLNGRDFFKGNNKAMLENLPSFTVRNIEVYRKTSDQDKWLGKETKQKTLAMDVKLKHEYNTGLLGNAEAAGGTNDRYLGKLFGMRYTDCSRLSLFGNINNVNEERRPGNNGDWDPTKTVPGQKTTRTAGIDLNIDEKEHRWREHGSVLFTSTSTNDESKLNAEHYTTEGSTFSRHMSQADNKSISIGATNNFSLMLSDVWVSSYVSVNYNHGNNNGLSRGATADKTFDDWGDVQSSLDSVFASELNPELQAQMINRTANRNKYKGDSFDARTNLSNFTKLKSGDYISSSADFSYSKHSGDNFNQQNINYFRTAGIDIALNKYNTNPRHNYNYGFGFGYTYSMSDNISIEANVSYRQDYNNSNSEYYLLDRLEGWGADGDHSIGELPSNRSEMLTAFDANNSFCTNELKRTPTLRISPTWNKDNDDFAGWAGMSIPLSYEVIQLKYFSAAQNEKLNNKTWKITPQLYGYVRWIESKFDINFNAGFDNRTVNLLDKIDRRNDENPLNIRLGNPDLKNTLSESASIYIGKTWKKKHEVTNRIGLSWRAEQRSVSQGYTYDRTTGVYTFRPVNVDGNWNTSVNDNLNIGFGESKKWNLSNYVNYSFVQSVDMATEKGNESSGISKVKTNSIEDRMNLNYTFKDLTCGLSGNVMYRHSASEREDFETVNATNFSYGMNLIYKIPWIKATIATDIKMFSRRGYSSKDLNTDDLIWNASLSKPLLKGKLTAVIEAYDILHQMTNTNIFINAQGRTEISTNTLPRYAMLHLRWNFNKMPKTKVKKKE
jgi:hypothetical protein